MSQITLLTGPERRRRGTDEDKRQILEEAFGPGGNVVDAARRHDVSSGLIYTWRAKARASMIPGFVEAVIAEESVVTDAGGGAVIQVELASARVSISGTASPVLVDVVLRALR